MRFLASRFRERQGQGSASCGAGRVSELTGGPELAGSGTPARLRRRKGFCLKYGLESSSGKQFHISKYLSRRVFIMQTLTVEGSGLLYLFRCLKEYSGECLYLLLYAISLVYIFTRAGKGEKGGKSANAKAGTEAEEEENGDGNLNGDGEGDAKAKAKGQMDVLTFDAPALMMLLTVFNPIFPLLVNRFFDVNKEYYRFFWLAPVTISVPYAVSDFIGSRKEWAGKILAFAAILLILFGCGSYAYRDGYTIAGEYKVDPEVIQVSGIIHEHSDQEYPRAICDFNLEMELRQYDASIMLTATRQQYLEAVTFAETDEQVKERNKYVNLVLDVVALNKDIPVSDFLEGMEQTNTEFVVVSKASPMLSYLEEKAGLIRKGETAGRVVLCCDLPEKKVNELADYTDLWNAQPFPWSLLN